MQESYSSANEHIRALRQQLDVAQRKLEAAECQLEVRRNECESQTMKYEEVVERLAESEQKVKESELLRRKLHNTILVCPLRVNGFEAPAWIDDTVILLTSSCRLTSVSSSFTGAER